MKIHKFEFGPQVEVAVFIIFYLLKVVNCDNDSTNSSIKDKLVELNMCDDDGINKVEGQNIERKEKLLIIPAEIAINAKDLTFSWKNNPLPGCDTKISKQIKLPYTISAKSERSFEKLVFSVGSDTFVQQQHERKLTSETFQIPEIIITNETETPVFTPDGYIFFQNENYHAMEYCISMPLSTPSNLLQTHSTQINLCPLECGKSVICINKCCPPGQVVDMEIHACKESGNYTWNPIIYAHKNPLEKQISDLPLHFNIQLPRNCSSISSDLYSNPIPIHRDFSQKTGIHSQSPLRILTTGNVVSLDEHTGGWDEIGTTPFCIDGIQNFGYGEYYSGLEKDEILIMCVNDSHVTVFTKSDNFYKTLYPIMLFISAGFLFITSIVQGIILEKKTAHGWAILCSMVSMFFTYLFLGMSYAFPILFSGTSTNYLKTIPCILVGILTHYFLLSTFSWMTVFDYDIWKTFRSIDGLSQKFISKRRLYAYFLFGFGISAVIVITGISLDFMYKRKNPSSGIIILPKYGQVNCYINPNALGVYVYSIIGILMVFNLFFICSTVTNIQTVRTGARDLQRSLKQQSAWQLFGKLFIIMGVTWVLEVVSWVHSQISKSTTDQWYWIMSDIINILQPVAIFIIIVCKRKTIRQLQFKFNSFKNIVTSFPNFSRTSISIFSPTSSKHRTSTSRNGSLNATSLITLNDVTNARGGVNLKFHSNNGQVVI